jgi:putative DNA primase/helicase
VSDEPETPADKVKRAMSRKRPVTDAPIEVTRGKTTLKVHEGGKAPRKPRKKKPTAEEPYALYGDTPPPEGEPDRPDDGGHQPPDAPPEDLEKVKDCASLDQNDRDNARRLIIWFGTDIVYVSGMGWLTWRGTHWQRDEGDLGARLKAQNLVDCIKLEAAWLKASPLQQRVLDAGELARKKKPEERTEFDERAILRMGKILEALSKKRSDRLKFAVSSGNSGKTEAMLRQAASLKAIDATGLDKDLHQFNVRNGTLRFVRSENPESDPDSPTYAWALEFDAEHRREDMNTKLAEVDYDPAAECPQFIKFVTETQPEMAMRLFIQIFHAYALLIGGNDEQKLVFHYGTGANGKSAFMEAIGRMAGTYRAVVSPDTITGDGQRDGSKANSDIARLHSARFVTVEELQRGVPLKEGLIKSLTGGTRQVARFLQKENFEFDPIFTAVMSGNDMPTVSGTDYGIWRRLLIVKWAVTIAEADRIPFGELMKTFDAERSGILNWLIEGALRYLNEGLAPFIPKAVTEFTEEYREERDNVGVFAESHFQPSLGASVKAGEAYKAYTEWCEANGLRSASQRAFGDRLNALGFRKKRGGYYVYLDVVLVRDGNARKPGPFDDIL